MKTREINPFFWMVVILCSVALIGLGGSPALAQDSDVGNDGSFALEELPEILGDGTVETVEGEMPAEADESFGRNTQATWFGSFKCFPTNSNEDWTSNSLFQIYNTAGNGIWYCPIQLPSGARVTQVSWYYWDNTFSNLNLRFGRNNSQTSVSTLFNTTPNVSGNYFVTTWFTAQTIANGGGWYWACFDLPTASGANARYWGIRVLWNRQIRTGLPNPFSDIGGESFDFQNSIKALAASGITVGFPDGTFRPDFFVTRGQFAAFFARALGLYWAYPTY